MLKELAESVQFNMSRSRARHPEPPKLFIAAGGEKAWPIMSSLPRPCKEGLMSDADDWECAADLPDWNQYPEMIRKSGLRPDIVLHSQTAKEIILIELTVPYESRIEAAHLFKTEKYADLAKSLREDGFKTKVFAIEVGARGFIGSSAYSLMKQLSISGKSMKRTLKAMAEAAEKSSSWIWSRRNKPQLHKH